MSFRHRTFQRLAQPALVLLVCLSAVSTGLTLPRRSGGAQEAQGQAQAQSAVQVSAESRAALERITAESLRGHLSFIASDALEGRNTPSRGLDIAAEYIAAQFRRAGLEPVGDDGYFQTANWSQVERDMSAFALQLNGASGGPVTISAEQVSLGTSLMGRSFWAPEKPLALRDAAVVKVDYADAGALAALTREQVGGKVVLTEIPDLRRADRARWMEMFGAQDAFLRRMNELGAALVISVDRQGRRGSGAGGARLVNPARTQQTTRRGDAGAPLITVHGALVEQLDALKAGPTGLTLNATTPAPVERPVRLRNVAGLLRGSDPALRDTYVLVTAHYDHLGMDATRDGDQIFNGANDDGSGTVGVVELASALASMKRKPKRSILFMTFFGEEKGLLGSRHYGQHPLVPLAKTVAQINLEQLGRTDDSEGPQVGSLSGTGFDYSDIPPMLRQAGGQTGVRVYKHPQNSDAFFSRSDNQALADLGIPAHTFGVAFEFPDYHETGDEWQKIDYANMARVVQTVGLGVLMIADNPQEPRWNESNPRTAAYVKAWKQLHPTP